MPSSAFRACCHPLTTVDPDDDAADLEALRDLVGDARVVALGESAHWTSEYTRLRDRIIRFLVRELGFSAFVLESGLPEGLLVNPWLHGQPGNLDQIGAEGMTYGFGRCAEMHAQLAWLRSWNTAHPHHQVRFYGMDVPGWGANPAPGVAACLDRIPPQPGDQALRAAADLGTPTAGPAPDASDAPIVLTGLAEGIGELVDRAAAADDELALRCARGAQAVVSFLTEGLYPAPGRNLRNEAMADNLRWLLEREHRIVVGAHNVHLQYTPSFDGTAPVGQLLAEELGDQLVVIGTTHGPARIPGLDLTTDPTNRFAPATSQEPAPLPPDSIDAAMDTIGPLHLTGLRHAPPQAFAGITTMAGQDTFFPIEAQQAFDALAHVRTITPAHGM
jgi:erythromycin esterase-like protein